MNARMLSGSESEGRSTMPRSQGIGAVKGMRHRGKTGNRLRRELKSRGERTWWQLMKLASIGARRRFSILTARCLTPWVWDQVIDFLSRRGIEVPMTT